MNTNELRSLAGEHNLRGYSRLRKDGLINLLRTHIHISPDSTLGADNQTEPDRNASNYSN